MYDEHKRITSYEFEHHIRPNLMNSHHFTHEELNRVESLFANDLHKQTDISYKQGIHEKDIDATFKFMHEHQHMHLLSPHKMDALESALRGHFGSSGEAHI